MIKLESVKIIASNGQTSITWELPSKVSVKYIHIFRRVGGGPVQFLTSRDPNTGRLSDASTEYIYKWDDHVGVEKCSYYVFGYNTPDALQINQSKLDDYCYTVLEGSAKVEYSVKRQRIFSTDFYMITIRLESSCPLSEGLLVYGFQYRENRYLLPFPAINSGKNEFSLCLRDNSEFKISVIKHAIEQIELVTEGKNFSLRKLLLRY